LTLVLFMSLWVGASLAGGVGELVSS
jgi:hypothetical protein